MPTPSQYPKPVSLCWVAAAVMLVSAVCSTGFGQSTRCLLADGFDFPVGKPDARGYFKARGYTANGHMGEDWNGNGGGDTDLGDPIYATARGVVIVSEDIKVGWGNCIIVRHAYRDASGKVMMVDSQYGHLNERKAKVGDIVERGQLIATMGSNRGMYPVHLHFEMRKNLHIGMNRSQFARDDTNYYSPTAFINAHRTLPASFATVDIPTKGFTPYGVPMAEAAKGMPVTINGGGVASRNFRIPVYKDETKGTAKVAPPKDTVGKIRAEVQKTAPPAAAPQEKSDFWTRLKNKFSNGTVVPADDKKR